jgi:hypothetical protein
LFPIDNPLGPTIGAELSVYAVIDDARTFTVQKTR